VDGGNYLVKEKGRVRARGDKKISKKNIFSPLFYP